MDNWQIVLLAMLIGATPGLLMTIPLLWQMWRAGDFSHD